MRVYHFCPIVDKSKVVFGHKHNGTVQKVVKFGKTNNLQIMVDFVQIIVNMLNTISVQIMVNSVQNIVYITMAW